jgi:hypothetical protein
MERILREPVELSTRTLMKSRMVFSTAFLMAAVLTATATVAAI